ncbi:ABC transporter permease [Galbitalea sp. SE-J8]|uniref:ABC transporter permease n=1 Tax=Galbitalea sp. SE-J8 TaxID=3054952 RepID=UPI00259C8B72|nr:ABC transporter permease [Galbitalea sp. SE-J8]MDM4763546.1 ABC transporter permease [Galbitalea sp. SE-J8]
MTALPARATRSPVARYRHALWLLASRDLKKRYSTSALGYIWSVLDPLLMAAVYWFVFAVVFGRGAVGETPYIVFLLTALLPWTWFNGAVSDATRAFSFEAKLVRSTTIPRTIWVASLVLSKGVEFLLSIPVLAVFAIVGGATAHWQLVLWLPAIAIQTVLTLGVGLIVAPLVVFLTDLHRAVKLILRVLFYASPIVYGVTDLPAALHDWAGLNPLTGILSLYRAGFFPQQLDVPSVLVSALVSIGILLLGLAVFGRSEAAVLKEI